MDARWFKILNVSRRLYLKGTTIVNPSLSANHEVLSWNVGYPQDFTEDYANMDGNEFSAILQQRILGNQPTLLTRFGSDIMMCTLAYLNQPNLINCWKYVSGQRDSIGLQPWVIDTMTNNAGFYSEREEYLERDLYKYGELINSIVPKIDMLATVLHQERFYANYFDAIPKCFLPDIEPYRQKNPWTKALRGKRVLVIHPFEKSIRYQYEHNRDKIFVNPDMLPDFQLMTIRAVQSIAGNRPKEHKDWFDALHHMENQIDNIGDFDVAIIGCGAYGMPLAAHIKRLGKIAIHMGGGVQYLFGIVNKRADTDEDATIRNLYNEYWIRPFLEDTPSGIEKVEGGCYW